MKCRERVTRLFTSNYVKLLWVLGQNGVQGNDGADALVKLGSLENAVGPEPVLPDSASVARFKVGKLVKEQFIDYLT